ncbi:MULTISPECIES: hypothetical protein [unclassified Microbacterium]|uniref:hypothetical protein n=1 Tax=unclassified Microbacterium TaxID=2609290 RepID=UPI003865AE73
MPKSGTPAQVKAKFATWDDYDWYGKCAAVVHTVCRHFGDVGKDNAYPSARAAFEDTKIESTDPAKAPRGAVHYWDYVGLNSRRERGNWGHVGIDMLGGGTDVLNATSYPNDKYGTNVGTSSVAQINKRVGKYRGWSRTYGESHYAVILAPTVKPVKPAPKPATTTPAKPAATPIPEDEDMAIYVKAKDDTQKRVWQVAGGKKRHIKGAEWGVIQALYEALGRDLPYTSGKLTMAQLNKLPTIQ